MAGANDIVNIAISLATQTASQENFGTPLAACYHTHNTDAVREYESVSAMLADNFHSDEPAVLIADAVFSQNPSPPSLKIGRRTLAPTQTISLVPQTPTLGRVYHINVDTNVYPAPSPSVQNSVYTADSDDTVASVCEQFAAAINTARTADADAYVYSGDSQPAAGGIIASGGVSSSSPQTVSGASLNGLVGGAAMSIPRSINFIFSSSANWNSATPIVVTGLNSRGTTVTENIPVPSGGGSTVKGVRKWKQITSIAIPAQGGSSGTYTMGINARTLAETGDAILETGASTTGTQTLTGVSLDGAIGTLPIPFGRVLTMTFNNHSDWSSTNATIKGTDRDGNSISDTFAIPSSGNATVTGTKVFGAVTEIDIPAQGGTHGTFVVGVASRQTATYSSSAVTVTTRTAGVLLSYDSWVNTQGGTDTVTLTDATTDPGIATDLATILAADNAWYGLLLDSNSQAEVQAAAAWVEPSGSGSQPLVFVSQSADGGCWNSGSTTDVMAVLKAHSYTRTACIYTPNIGDNWIAAAWLANRLPADPGSDTWAFKLLPSIEVYSLTASQQAAILAKNGNIYIAVAGLDFTQFGTAASGQYMDLTRFIDWLKGTMQAAFLTLLANTPKWPYTDGTVAVFVQEILSILKQGVTVGGFVPDSVSASGPKVATVPQSQRANRILPNLKFAGTYAGAVHEVQIEGTVSL